MKKKLISIILTIIAMTTFLACCGNCNEDTPETPIGEQSASVRLNFEKRELTLGDTLHLIASADGVTENTDLTWKSSDDQVATVDENGNISATGIGEAIISAMFGTGKAECNIVVATNGNIPTLRLNAGFENNNLNVHLGNQINLSCNVLFNQKEFADVNVSYAVADPTVGKVEANAFTPLKKGSTTVTITANWRGLSSSEYETMTQVLTVKVSESQSIVLDGGEYGEEIALQLYSQAEHGGKTFKNTHTLQVQAFEGESEKTCIGQVIEGKDVIEYDDSTRKITAEKYGTAKIKYAFTSSEGSEYSVTLSVQVGRPTVSYSQRLRFSAFDSTFSDENQQDVTLKDIFGYDTSLVTVEQDGNDAITIENGAISNLYLETKEDICDTTLTVYDDKVGYILSLDVCAKYIYDAEDLRVFEQGNNKTSVKILDGYFLLCNDIVDREYEYNKFSLLEIFGGSYVGTWYDDYGFRGIFEGNGHFLTFTTYSGLFNSIQEESEIRNVEFKNITVKSRNSNGYLSPFGLGHGSLLKNVAVSLSQDTYTNFASLDDTDKRGRTLHIFPYGNPYSDSMRYENVVFTYDYQYIAEDADNSSIKKAVLFENSQYYRYKNFTNPFVNIYVIELNKEVGKNYELPLTIGGRKQDYEYQYTYYHTLEEFAELVKVFVYESSDAIKNYFETADGKIALATFDSRWLVNEQGYPIWASSYNALDYVEYLGTGIFSGWDNDGRVADGFAKDTDNDDQELPSNLKTEGNVTGVYLVESVNTVSDFTPENNLYAKGKVKITHTGSSQIEYKNIYITTDADKIYKATLEVYTRIINSKEDLRMFDLDGIDGNGKLIKGYYILGSDIVDTEETYNGTHILDTYNSISGDKLAWGAFAGATGFSGVFDGRGHTLTIKTGTGLFGASIKARSVIKNVNFKDCIIVKNDRYGSVLGNAGASGITVENIFISLAKETYENYAQDSVANLHVLMDEEISGACCVTAKNVIFELDYSKMKKADATSEKKYIIFINKLAANNGNYVSTEGVYVVKLNYDETATYAREFKAIGDTTNSNGSVSEYETYDALKEYFAEEGNENKLSAFNNDCWDTSSGYPTWKNSTTA